MRFLSLIALVMLTACAQPPQTEVTMSRPTEAGSTTGLVPMQGFSGHGFLPPQRSNAEIAADILNLEFRMESGRPLLQLSRFSGPITLAMAGAIPPTAPGDLSRLVARFRNEAGLDVRMAAPGQPASITINFERRAALQRVVPTAACFVVPGVTSLADYQARRGSAAVDWAEITVRQRVAVFVPADTSPQEVRDCLHEELAQAMGPLNDLYSLPDSVFNDDNFHTVLTGFDMLALRVHYAPELRAGMNEAEVARLLPGILAAYNPAGEFRGAAPERLSPRSWNEAVAQALGTGSSPAQRQAGAERMLSIAKAQGWRDNRLGFAHFVIGRMLLSREPDSAIAHFSEALRIYNTLPDGGLHAAHVHMQLAAISLAAGESEQALGYADRAIPVVRRAENAALLATLEMIKSHALANLGRAAEARALSLDSQSWARYGFGGEGQIRAHQGEIAALAARGQRG
jgi:tetratricopeptide (TPR) repeat protein